MSSASDEEADQAEASKHFVENYIYPNIKVLKKCFPTTEECWITPVDLNGTLSSEIFNYKRFSFITTSGYSVYGWVHQVGNGGWFYVDVNGLKKPNAFGKDVFIFQAGWGDCEKVYPSAYEPYYVKIGLNAYGLEKKGLNPSRETLLDKCKQGVSGKTCSGLIMYDGWEIAPDYPW